MTLEVVANEVGPSSRKHDHAVQFYDDDEFLADAVARFLLPSLATDAPAVLIVTAEHRRLFVDRLARSGVAVDELVETGQLVLLDADETLAEFMVDGMPVWRRFRPLIEGVLATCRRGSDGCVRAYGEMVDVLWRAGNPQAAIALEEMWNELGTLDDFSLLCAYLMDNFLKHADGDGFAKICERHTHVAPTGSYGRLSGAERDREVSLLQQRARALEHEVAHRERLERELRDALRARAETQRRLEETLARETAGREAAERTIRFNELFAGILGHDLRNPLAAITAGAHHLVRIDAGEKVSKIATRMLGSSERMARMIDQLLDFTRLRVGEGLELQPSSMDLGILCERVKDELEAAHGRRLDFVSEGDAVGSWDGDRLLQLFSNLVGNALSHGVEGASVGVRVDGRDADVVRVSVRNAGTIPPDVFAVLFEPFRGGPKQRRATGLGLGLYISQQIAIAHGGTLVARSSDAEGTTLLVTLPRRISRRGSSSEQGGR